MEGTVMVSTGQVTAVWSARNTFTSDRPCSFHSPMQTSMNVLKAQQVATRHV